MANLHEFKATAFVQGMADIMEPSKCEQPILEKNIRDIVFQWFTERSAVKELKAVGLKPRQKLMFSGPPGCGKTTLAHHMAARVGVPLVVVNMQAIVSCYVGETGNNLDKLFRDLIPVQDHCVLFMDEFDSMATQRGAGGQAYDAVVIALLQKIDMYGGCLIAATNLKDKIDRAIWRRFDMQVEIAEPGTECRFAILKRYLMPFGMADDDLSILVEATAGATPALLRNLAENIKRDLVLQAKLKLSTDSQSVMRRAVTSSVPHTTMTLPPLWSNSETYADALSAHWPPKRA